jgi:hypothetical protein
MPFLVMVYAVRLGLVSVRSTHRRPGGRFDLMTKRREAALATSRPEDLEFPESTPALAERPGG